ncbi:spermidine synthase [Ruegeria sp. HKCCD8929]|uniref:spermidine synthase n=1 Tax=Ruegeria sp. HKCCD8929 TaxID=2683006 RepID=UPI0014882FE1|nr:fused MFS/spermidine synthase [Ruegeria sp. HKCCD8929]
MADSDPTRFTSAFLSGPIQERLKHLRDLPDGVVEHRRGQIGQVVVAKDGNELFLVFCPSGVPLTNGALSGVMSRIDLTDPLTLTGGYTQAMLLCLAFVPEPVHVYVMGGGGGRVPTVLHALFDEVIITGSEIDPDVLDLSYRFFGLEDGPRLRIACVDGRSHLAGQADGQFDHIYLDCFTSDGRVPEPLTTPAFFEMCAKKLRAGGVVCMNFVDSDPRLFEQRKEFQAVFANVRMVEVEGTHVLFGRKEACADTDVQATARTLQARLPFGFDLQAYADRLRVLPASRN